jgi:hypothetical protein
VSSATSATNGVVLTPEGDGSLFATGAATFSDYTVTYETPLSRITGVRIDTIPDPRLPSGGAGTGFGGNFALTELHVTVRSRP